jgi:hypothetical protein
MKEKALHLKRPLHPMPDDIKETLHADGLMGAYLKETPIPAGTENICTVVTR